MRPFRSTRNARQSGPSPRQTRFSSGGTADPGGGFTAVELTVIIVIVAILALIAIPRFFDIEVFQARGTSGEVLGVLRYAQNTAVAHRRSVYVRIDSATGAIALCYANDFPCDNPANQVPGPNNEKPYSVTARGSAIAPDVTFFFDALGRPYNTGDVVPSSSFTGLTVSVVGGGDTVATTVERETGYVHR